MIGFDYIYANSEKIFHTIRPLMEFQILDFIILLLFIGFIVGVIFFIFPPAHIFVDYIKEKKAKRKKKEMIQRILLQKSIEDEIARELKTHQD